MERELERVCVCTCVRESGEIHTAGMSPAIKSTKGGGGGGTTIAAKMVPGGKEFAMEDAPSSSSVTYPRKSLPLIRDVVPPSSSSYRADGVVGRVRATPPGHMLSSSFTSTDNDVRRWHEVRSATNKYGIFAREGFDHALGADEVRIVDGMPLGGHVPEIDGESHVAGEGGRGRGRGRNANTYASHMERLEPEEEDALRAELAGRRLALSRMEGTGLLDDIDGTTHRVRVASTLSSSSSSSDAASGMVGGDGAVDDGHEYGASRTTLDSPIGGLREKWRVLPHFLKLRGLMRQHIDSFDHFVSVEMKQIVQVSLRFLSG